MIKECDALFVIIIGIRFFFFARNIPLELTNTHSNVFVIKEIFLFMSLISHDIKPYDIDPIIGGRKVTYDLKCTLSMYVSAS